MLKFYFHHTPNPMKVALFLAETGIGYELIPVDTLKGEQHEAWFREINPNGKTPVIEDAGNRIFDSNAILIYLAEKTGQLYGKPEDRGEMLSWLMFVATGIGPYSGQAVHMKHFAPKNDYAINRYHREVERHYQVLDDHLAHRDWIVGDDYSIADISAWGWIDRACVALGGDDPLAAFPNIRRWFETVNARPAVASARDFGKGIDFKKDRDEAALRALFPTNYAEA